MATYTHARKRTETIKTETEDRTIWLWFTSIACVVVLAVCAIIAHSHSLNGWQARLFYDVDNLSGRYTGAAKIVTEGLGAAYPIGACVLIPLVFKKYRIAWRFLATVGGAFVASYIIKKLVAEPRPIAMLHGHLQQRVIETGPGFPSAHETVAAAMAFTLWFLLPAKWRFISIIWIVIVGISRLYLGVHTPVDIIGGLAIGLLAVCVVRLLPEKLAAWLRLDEA